MKHKCKLGSPASILMRGHHASGGETMSRDMGGGIAPRRVAPNMEQKFKKGGHCIEHNMEEHLEKSSRKKNGISSKRKTREHHFLGALAGALLPHVIGPIGDLAGRGIKKFGDYMGLKKGGKPKEEDCRAKKAIGGVGKTRKHYPMT